MNVNPKVNGEPVPKFENHDEENDAVVLLESRVAQTIFCQLASQCARFHRFGLACAAMISFRATCKRARYFYSKHFNAIIKAGTDVCWKTSFNAFSKTVRTFGILVRDESWCDSLSSYDATVWIDGLEWKFSFNVDHFSFYGVKGRISMCSCNPPHGIDLIKVARDLLPAYLCDMAAASTVHQRSTHESSKSEFFRWRTFFNVSFLINA